MSDRKPIFKRQVLAALFALALVCGCRIFPPKTSQVASISSAPEARKASHESEEAEEKKGLGWEDLSPDKLVKTAKSLVTAPPDKKEAQKSFDEADAAWRQARALPEGEDRQKIFLEAARKFSLAAEKFPKSALEQESLFLAGESYLDAGYYWEANRSYEKLVKAHPNNRYLDTVEDRRYQIAKYWLELGKKDPESFYAFNLFNQERPWRDTRGHGLRVFEKMRTVDDPGGKLAAEATLALGNEY